MGVLNNSKFSVLDCYNVATVSGGHSTYANGGTGGIAGQFGDGSIANSYNYGNVTLGENLVCDNLGGVIGRDMKRSGAQVENVYYLDSSCANASTSGADERVTAVSAADFAGESFLRKLNADGCFILRSGKYPELEMAADLVGSDPVLTVVLKDSHGSVTGEQSFTARQLSGLSQTGAVGYQYWKKGAENLAAATKYVTLETLLKAAGADFTPGMTVSAADAAGKRLVSGVVTVTVQTCVHDGESQDVPGSCPACTQPGVTAGVKCTDCGVIVSGCTEIPAAGHTPELRDAKDAGCTQDGYTGNTYCSVCGAEDPGSGDPRQGPRLSGRQVHRLRRGGPGLSARTAHSARKSRRQDRR